MADHAVVLGGSIAGSLAARVLAENYEQVTVLDRDELSDVTQPRRAVPQGHHIHALLARGQQILEEIFPGFTHELISRGVPVGDFGTSLSWYFNGTMIRKAHTGLVCVAAGRPLLENYLRSRVSAMPNVTFRGRTDICGLVASTNGSRIAGVRVQSCGAGTSEVLDADLVVDTTGRGSRTPRWLEELGYGQVEEERVAMDLTYTTCDYRAPLPFDPIGEDIAIITVATPTMPRGAIFARMPDRYSISLTGLLGDRPPTDHDGFLEYVKSLPVPAIYHSARWAEPLGRPTTFRFPASIRRRYERMPKLPCGLLAMGDAACVFNPVYAQGMTVAAIETLVLAQHLADGKPHPAGYFRDLARVIEAPWDMSAGADLGFRGTKGRRTLKVRLGNAYIPRLQAAAVTDASLSAAFLRTAGLVDAPNALLRPTVIARVLFPRSRGPGAVPDRPTSRHAARRPTSERILAGQPAPAAALGGREERRTEAVMAPATSTKSILHQLTDGDAEPVLVAEFRAWTTAPRLSQLLSERALGHPVYQIDPVGLLSADQLYVPLPDLAAACVKQFSASGPSGGRVFIAGHCSASALSLHVASRLKASRDVTAILVGPVWPEEEQVRNRFAEALSNFGVPGRPCPELAGDPTAAVARMEHALKEELDALAARRGVNGAAKAFAELLAWHRGWLAFLLACHNGPPMAWAEATSELIVLTGSTGGHSVPGLSHEAYHLFQAPILGEQDPITPELAESVLAQITTR